MNNCFELFSFIEDKQHFDPQSTFWTIKHTSRNKLEAL